MTKARKTTRSATTVDTPTTDTPTPDAPSPVEEEAATIDPRDPDAAEEVEALVREANHGADPDVAIGEAAADVAASAYENAMCDVTFRCSDTEASRVAVAGDFNAWSSESHPMQRTDRGFEVTVPLETGRRYRYRFVVDGRWEDDPSADEHEPNEYGTRNAIRST